ncbi:hypothetical protein MMC07_007409 [Pseudocyphellaria aurata]|nr:hypothetical protein [Pseudocyphellaria aurata]
MTSKLIPSDSSKVMVIRKITPSLVTCSSPFNRFGKFKIGGRGTIVRLESGAIAVFSPTALTPEVRSTVEELGNNVAYLAAMDFEHHIFLSDWAKAFPSAKVMGVEGLPEKREADPATAGTTFSWVFTTKNKASLRIDPDFDREFDYEYVDSHANKELVVNHRPNRTLITADMVFNLPAHEQYSRTDEAATDGWLTKFFTSFQNTRGTAIWQQRFIWHVASKSDRPSFARSCRTIASWDFDRLIPCHGDVIETGGKGIFKKVMAWHLKGEGK